MVNGFAESWVAALVTSGVFADGPTAELSAQWTAAQM
jgi:hypothetical protein